MGITLTPYNSWIKYALKTFIMENSYLKRTVVKDWKVYPEMLCLKIEYQACHSPGKENLNDSVKKSESDQ